MFIRSFVVFMCTVCGAQYVSATYKIQPGHAIPRRSKVMSSQAHSKPNQAERIQAKQIKFIASILEQYNNGPCTLKSDYSTTIDKCQYELLKLHFGTLHASQNHIHCLRH